MLNFKLTFQVQRVALEQLVLRVKALKLPGPAADVCAQLPEPPSAEAVAVAVHELAAIGALTAVGEEGNSREGGNAYSSFSSSSSSSSSSSMVAAGEEDGMGGERLTPLGTLLCQLPIDARLGKLITFGLCFGCADEVRGEET